MMVLGRILGIALALALVVMLGARWPHYNWDMIGYVAVAYQEDGLKGQALLNNTYADVRSFVNESSYHELISGKYPEYRARVASDPSALEQQIPFYSIRVPYVELMRLLKSQSFSYAAATQAISAGFTLLSVLALSLIFFERNVPIALLSVVIVSAGYPELASMSLPDSMVCFVAFIATWLMLRGNRSAIMIASLLPLFRTDYVILSILLLGFSFATGSRITSAIGLMVSVLLVWLINTTHGAYDWLTLMNFTFLHFAPYPAQMVPSPHLSDYISIYYGAGMKLLGHTHVLIYCLALFIWISQRKQIPLDNNLWLLLFIPLAFLAIHLLLFPLLEVRFFVYSSSLVLVWIFTHLISNAQEVNLSQPDNTG